MKRLALGAAVLLATTAVNAQIYQWKDEHGKTVISDKPPTGNVSQQRKVTSETAAVNNSTHKSTAEKEMDFRKRQKESQEGTEKTSKEQAAAAEKNENCERARRQLQALDSGERIAMQDEKGERYYLDDAQREREAAKARQAVQSNCR